MLLDYQIPWLLKIQSSLIFFSGEFWLITTYLGNGAFLLAILLCATDFKQRSSWFLLPFSLILAAIVQGTLKRIFLVSRPLKVLGEGNLLQLGPKVYEHSFPSGHTTAAFAFFAVVLFYKRDNRLLLALSLIYAVFIALSRLMVGAHWPLDLVGGAVVGFGVVYGFLTYAHRQPDLDARLEKVEWLDFARHKDKARLVRFGSASLILLGLALYYSFYSFEPHGVLAAGLTALICAFFVLQQEFFTKMLSTQYPPL